MDFGPIDALLTALGFRHFQRVIVFFTMMVAGVLFGALAVGMTHALVADLLERGATAVSGQLDLVGVIALFYVLAGVCLHLMLKAIRQDAGEDDGRIDELERYRD